MAVMLRASCSRMKCGFTRGPHCSPAREDRGSARSRAAAAVVRSRRVEGIADYGKERLPNWIRRSLPKALPSPVARGSETDSRNRRSGTVEGGPGPAGACL